MGNDPLTHVITVSIQLRLAEDDSWETSKRRMVERMRNATDRGVHDVITWSRDEIHER
jgi:hypothetical protein